MNFLFSPPWMALINFAHLVAVLAAVTALVVASGRQRALALVLVLAAAGWVVTVILSALIIHLPAGAQAPRVLGWAPVLSAIPTWGAVVAGLAALWRTESHPPSGGK